MAASNNLRLGARRMGSINLADMFVGAADSYRDRPAIVSRELTLSYRQMVARSAQTARVLRREGIKSGDIVGLALSSPGDTVAATIALWMLGATVVILDFRTRAEERNALCLAFGVSVIVESRRPPGKGEYASLLFSTDWNDRILREDSTPFSPEISGAPAILSLTSGTTGTPQGIQINHDTFLLRHLMHGLGDASHETKIYLNPLSLNNAASRNHTLSRLLEGGTVHFVPFLSTAEELCEALVRTEANYALMVPAQALSLLQLSRGRSTPLFPKLASLYCGGAPMTPENNIRAYRELSRGYRVLYGSSVAGTMAVLSGMDVERKPETVGRPLPLVRLQIVDPQGQPLPAGQVGAIRVRSPAISPGIVGSLREKSDRLLEGWAYPGDLGVLDEEGFLTITGRASDMILRGGVNVFPQEVEDALCEHPLVAEAAVVGWQKGNVGEEIAAFVVRKGEVTADELIAFSRSRLSPDKRPRFFFFIEKLPRNDMGKVLRRQLAASLDER
jgi:fatty-acyl-CoA synthase